MPTYVYECDSCEHRFEERQGFDDDPLTDCPRCEGSVRRVFHPAPIIFKGRGFYVTDSRPAGDGGVASTASGDSGASGAKETTAAESSEGGSGGDKEKTAATGEPPGD
ncbi:MAG: FmdB family zinc ribbon protein [Dehalococcoidales bacterium]